jgi:hypothetical protein
MLIAVFAGMAYSAPAGATTAATEASPTDVSSEVITVTEVMNDQTTLAEIPGTLRTNTYPGANVPNSDGGDGAGAFDFATGKTLQSRPWLKGKGGSQHPLPPGCRTIHVKAESFDQVLPVVGPAVFQFSMTYYKRWCWGYGTEQRNSYPTPQHSEGFLYNFCGSSVAGQGGSCSPTVPDPSFYNCSCVRDQHGNVVHNSGHKSELKMAFRTTNFPPCGCAMNFTADIRFRTHGDGTYAWGRDTASGTIS